jgi:hypothetical protein
MEAANAAAAKAGQKRRYSKAQIERAAQGASSRIGSSHLRNAIDSGVEDKLKNSAQSRLATVRTNLGTSMPLKNEHTKRDANVRAMRNAYGDGTFPASATNGSAYGHAHVNPMARHMNQAMGEARHAPAFVPQEAPKVKLDMVHGPAPKAVEKPGVLKGLMNHLPSGKHLAIGAGAVGAAGLAYAALRKKPEDAAQYSTQGYGGY